APSIEYPLHACQSALSIAQEYRPDIARPTIIQRRFEYLHFSAGGELGLRRFFRAHGKGHRLECRDRTGNARISLFRAQCSVVAAETFDSRRPAHPGAAMRLPFRGPTKALIGGIRGSGA